MILGKGAILSLYMNHKLNVKISTDGELIGVHDGLIAVLRSKYFTKDQGLTVEHNKLYQENKTIILMDINGRSLISKRERNIKERYFFIKDHI